MKKISFLLATVLMAAMLAGCGISDIKLFKKTTEETVHRTDSCQ